MVASLRDVQAALAGNTAQVVDARPADRFRGEAPEPRPGVRSGHIPGSLNVPSTELVENGRLLPPEQLKLAFAAGGVDLDKPVITSCGSGVSAATSGSRSRRSARNRRPSTTVHGRNGDRAPTFRSLPNPSPEPKS